MLDERFRQRVGTLARHGETPVLDEAARERILSRVASEGPAVVRRARRVRIALLSAGPVLAAAAAALVLVRGAPAPTEEGGSGLSGAGPAVMACAAREVPRAQAFTPVRHGQATELDLGHTALLRATPGASVRVVEAAACRTTLALGSGTVTVHARDLGGGELLVKARDGEVAVRGTVFAVTQSVEEFVVEVSEGRVLVTDRAGRHTVEKGERYALSSDRPSLGSLDGRRDGELREAVGLPKIVRFDSLLPAAGVAGTEPDVEERRATQRSPGVRAEQPAVSAAQGGVEATAAAPAELAESASPAPVAAPVDLLAEADAARRAGRFEAARELYRRAAGGEGVTAEAAWVALARMELSIGNAAQARAATKQRQQRFGQGTLLPESLWIDVRAYRQTGEIGLARELSAELARRWPGSPQARAAEEWLKNGR